MDPLSGSVQDGAGPMVQPNDVQTSDKTRTVKSNDSIAGADALEEKKFENSSERSDEYVSLLEKHLGLLEKELQRTQESQDKSKKAKPDTAKEESRTAQISWVAPHRWRQVKKDVGIDPKLDVLLASSRGSGRVRDRADQSRQQDITSHPERGHPSEALIEVPYRLALNSNTLFEALEECSNIPFPRERNVLLRPFKPLIIYNTPIRQVLREAEVMSAQERVEPSSFTGEESRSSDQNGKEDSNSLTADAVHETGISKENDISPLQRRRDELRCLVNFMDVHMKDIFRVLDDVSDHSMNEIAFEHTWLLYKPGDLLFSASASASDDDTMCQAYCVLHVTGGRYILDSRSQRDRSDRVWDTDSEGDDDARNAVPNSTSMTPFVIDCFSIDCDGKRYGPKSKRIVISEYKGKRSIESFDAYPAKFHPRYNAVRQALITRGRRFWDLATGKHRYYSGATVKESREVPRRPYYNYIIQDEEIHEEVMIDQAAAVTHFRYAMLNRDWYAFNINRIKDIVPVKFRGTGSGFDDLVLPAGHKKLLQAVVRHQISDPLLVSDLPDRNLDEDEFSMDLVKSKGKGLVILLHGAPGVGKTSTAECVAEQLNRPLLPITCGDIGTNVKEAEATLSKHCSLAYRWRCVLLLDEADIFLTKRESGDLQRNGLVSVFLRVLEYYSGVIILTTNRVGQFDEAFRSRIHVSLYYPRLDQASTFKIWERNLQRLRNSSLDLDFDEDEIRDFSENHWQRNKDNPTRRWNGRQIKNAFQTALALANWDYHELKQKRGLERPVLRAKHFERVADTSADFDDYISGMHNLDGDDTYSVLAARQVIRNDNHQVMSANRRQNEDDVPRSRRNPLPRRDFGRRNGKARESNSYTRDQTSQNDDDEGVEELKLKLQLAEMRKQKQSAKKKEVEAQSGEEDDDW